MAGKRMDGAPETRRGHGQLVEPAPVDAAPVARGPARLAGCVFVGAILAAPFLALLFDPTAGLLVMTLALAATAFLAGDAARAATAPTRRRLSVLVVVNGALALGCVAVLLLRLS